MQQGAFDKYSRTPGAKRQGYILIQLATKPPRTNPEEVCYKTKEQRTRFDWATRKTIALRNTNIGMFLALGNPEVPKEFQKKEISTTPTYVT